MAAIRLHISQAEQLKLKNALNQYATMLKKDASVIIKDEAKQITKELITQTYPKTGKAAGEKKIFKDLKNVALPYKINKSIKNDQDYIDNFVNYTNLQFNDFTKRISKYLKAKDYNALREIFKDIPRMRQWKWMEFSQEKHKQAIQYDSNGKINTGKFKWNLTAHAPEFKEYYNEMKKHVGKLKATWMPAADLTGVVVPGWIARNSDYGYRHTKAILTDRKFVIIAGTYYPKPMQSLAAFVMDYRSKVLLKKFNDAVARQTQKFNSK